MFLGENLFAHEETRPITINFLHEFEAVSPAVGYRSVWSIIQRVEALHAGLLPIVIDSA